MKPCVLAILISCLTLSVPSLTLADTVYTAAVFSADGQTVILGTHAGIEVRSWPGLDLVRRLDSGLEAIHDLAFSPDRQWLLVAGGSSGRRGEVECWRWTDQQVVHRVSCHEDVVMRVAWAPSGTFWVTASVDSTCQVRSFPGNESLATYTGHSGPVLTVVCFPDDQTIASAGVDGTIQVWQRHSAQRMRSLDNHLAGVNSLALLPSSYRTQASQVGLGDGPMMVSISEDKSLRLWQPSIGRLVRFVRLSQPVCALDVSSTGAQLAVATESGEMHVLESPTLTNIYTTRVAASRIYAIALAPEGTAALVAGRDCLQRVAW